MVPLAAAMLVQHAVLQNPSAAARRHPHFRMSSLQRAAASPTSRQGAVGLCGGRHQLVSLQCRPHCRNMASEVRLFRCSSSQELLAQRDSLKSDRAAAAAAVHAAVRAWKAQDGAEWGSMSQAKSCTQVRFSNGRSDARSHPSVHC